MLRHLSAKSVSTRSGASGMAIGIMVPVTCALLSGCGQKAAVDPRTLDPLVRTLAVAAGTEGGNDLTGVIHARYETDLGFRTSGKIAARLVDPGQHVRKGQVLIRLDPADYALNAQAADAQYEAARAQAERAAADEKRLRGLVQSGAISAQTYDQARAGATSTAQQAQAALAQRDVARRQSGYSELQADADGVVMSIAAEPGQVVTAGQPVLRLARDGTREAVVFVPEGVAGHVQKSARALLANAPGDGVPATLRQLAAAADPLTRTYEARFILGGAGGTAPLGSTVTVRLGSGRTKADLEVPLAAIVDRGAGTYVFVVDRGASVLVKRPVVVGGLTEETARVSSGLIAGDEVVALGAALLHPGQRVRIESRK